MNDRSYIFVSYRRTDHEAATAIVRQLESAGVTCWVDERDIPVGADWPAHTGASLRDAAAVLWLKSRACAGSGQVLKELQLAARRGQVIIPLQIDDAVSDWAPEWEEFVHLLQAVPLTNPQWFDRVTDRVLALPGFRRASEPELRDRFAPSFAVVGTATRGESAEEPNAHAALAILRVDGQTFQLVGLDGLSENLVENEDEFNTSDQGDVALSCEASVIATATLTGQVELWTHGVEESMRGPALGALVGPRPRLLAVDRPIGQSIRVLASAGPVLYSVMAHHDGTWAAMELLTADDTIVGGVAVKDDVLFVRETGGTAWASNRTKRPFSLRVVHGVDAAIGADGRYYLAAWGTGSDASRQVEVVVNADTGWQRVHRGAGLRAGIVRGLPDLMRRTRGDYTSLAVENEDNSVAVLRLS